MNEHEDLFFKCPRHSSKSLVFFLVYFIQHSIFHLICCCMFAGCPFLPTYLWLKTSKNVSVLISAFFFLWSIVRLCSVSASSWNTWSFFFSSSRFCCFTYGYVVSSKIKQKNNTQRTNIRFYSQMYFYECSICF